MAQRQLKVDYKRQAETEPEKKPEIEQEFDPEKEFDPLDFSQRKSLTLNPKKFDEREEVRLDFYNNGVKWLHSLIKM